MESNTDFATSSFNIYDPQVNQRIAEIVCKGHNAEIHLRKDGRIVIYEVDKRIIKN